MCQAVGRAGNKTEEVVFLAGLIFDLQSWSLASVSTCPSAFFLLAFHHPFIRLSVHLPT